MFKRHYLGLALAFATVAALAGCGSKDTGPSFNSTISDGDAADFGGDAVDFSAGMMSTFNFGGPTIGLAPARVSDRAIALLNHAYSVAGVRHQFHAKGRPVPAPIMLSASSCTPVYSGDTTDADGDGIANNATVTIDCSALDTASGTTTTLHEQVHINDVNALYGFNASVVVTEDEHNSTMSSHIGINESENASFTTSSANDQLNVDITESETDSGNTVGTQAHENWNATFTPDGAISTSDPLPSGSLSFTGGFYTVDLADATQNFNFSITTTNPLAYDSGCGSSPPFTSGLITGHLQGANADVGFTVNFENGCGNAPTIVGHGNEVV